jgi:hypothetical protein
MKKYNLNSQEGTFKFLQETNDKQRIFSEKQCNEVVNRLYGAHKTYHEKLEAKKFLTYENVMKTVQPAPTIDLTSKKMVNNYLII